MDKLPDEIIHSIFSLLNPQTLLKVACACGRWYQLSRDNQLWKPFFDSLELEEIPHPEGQMIQGKWKLLYCRFRNIKRRGGEWNRICYGDPGRYLETMKPFTSEQKKFLFVGCWNRSQCPVHIFKIEKSSKSCKGTISVECWQNRKSIEIKVKGELSDLERIYMEYKLYQVFIDDSVYYRDCMYDFTTFFKQEYGDLVSFGVYYEW